MSAMPESLRGFGVVVLALWVILSIAGYFYSQFKNIPAWVTWAVVPAFLVETALYVAAGTPVVRATFEKLKSPGKMAALMTLAAVVPYLMYAVGTGAFEWRNLALLALLAAAASFWYVVLPPGPVADLGFLAFLAAVYVLKVFQTIYIDPVPKLSLHVLGRLMWIRTGVLAILCLRRMDGIGFSFVPERRDWKIGVRHYFYFLPLGFLLAVAIGFLRPDPAPFSIRTFALALLTFAITLWVLAAMEEFFFRGLLQQILSRLTGNPRAGLLLTSAIFGAAHVLYPPYPNWRFALLAALTGWFYGRAYQKAGSVRASMVTHALVVTTWRVFLT